jgi:serine/threonine protein kinase
VAQKGLGPTPGQIGRYKIERIIGRGAMGVVFQAQDEVLRRTIALKTISSSFAHTEKARQAFERRFLDEARAAAALSHPGIVVVYDFGSDSREKVLFMALEFLRGKTLADVVAARLPLDWRETLKMVARIADALHHAHERRVIHRDIKPANIMVLGSGEAKIMDFGVAKMDTSELSAAGQVSGTPAYMSPEQAQGQPHDARTDIFSLGSVLYELLTGRIAFAAKDVAGVVLRLVHEDPTPVTRVVTGIPADVDRIVSRALAKRLDDRYPNARMLAEDVDDVLGDRPPRHTSPQAPPPGPITMVAAPEPAGSGTLIEDTAPGGSAKLGAMRLPVGKRITLAIIEGPQRGKVFPLEKPRLLIGRAGGDADVQLSDPQASRNHAAIECHGPRILLRDLGSTNGTFVGHGRIVDAALHDQSEFRIGRTRLMLIVAEL